MKITAERMKELRTDKELSQAQVALALGIDRSNYSKYELGKLDPSTEMLAKLAQYFGVSADFLLGLQDYK